MIKICMLMAVLVAAGIAPVPAVALDLVQIYALGVQNDPQLRASRSELDSTRESRPQALAQLLPTFSAGGTLKRTHLNTIGGGFAFGGGGGDDLYNQTEFRLSLSQPLFRMDYWIQLQQSDNQIAQAEAEYVAQQQDLVMRVAQAYFDVLSAQDTLGFTQAEKTAIRRQLDQAKQRFDVGLIAITAVYEAQAAFDKSRADVIQADNELGDAWEALHEIIGDSEKVLASLTSALPLASPEPEAIEAWSEAALQQNPGLIALRSSTAVARQNIKLQQTGHYPTVELVGDHSLSRTAAMGRSDSDVSSIGLQLRVPIYAGGGVTSRTRQARFDFENAQENLDKQRRAVNRQVRNAYRGVVSSISRVRALKATTVSAKSALHATEAGFEVGTRTMVDVLTEQRNLYRARRDYSFARYEYILNGLRLKQTVGSLSQQDLEKISAWLK